MRLIFQIIFLFCFLYAIQGQNLKTKNTINYCLIFGDIIGNPNQGIDIIDSNKLIEMIIQRGNNIDTNIIGLDKLGRIDFVKTFSEKSTIEYFDGGLVKKTKSNFSTPLLDCISPNVQYTYRYDNDGYVKSVKITCGKKTRLYNMKYTFSSLGVVVDLIDNKKIVRKNLFLFNSEYSYFQWEIITNRNIIFKFKKDKFNTVACLENDNKYKFIVIENITFEDPQNKSGGENYKDRYSIYDASGNVIGTINLYRKGRSVKI